jgi:hypothetical protein
MLTTFMMLFSRSDCAQRHPTKSWIADLEVGVPVDVGQRCRDPTYRWCGWLMKS